MSRRRARGDGSLAAPRPPVGGVDVVIECADGYPLSARVFTPEPRTDAAAGGPDGSCPTVVIAPATGAKARYYWRYADHLASAGLTAVVADYRGIGRSAPRGSPAALRHLQVRWHEWGTLDLDAVLGWAEQSQGGRGGRVAVVGHSFGGLAACLAPRATSISRLLMVGAQHAHWRDYAPEHRLQMLWRWHVVMPVLAAGLGYFPGQRLGWLEDLPRGVALDWARGSRDLARTIGGRDGRALQRAAALTVDVLAVASTDDPFATEPAIERALSYLPSASVERRLIAPPSVGVQHIGHLGLFHDSFRDTLWPCSARWLRSGARKASGSHSEPGVDRGDPGPVSRG